MKLNRSSTCGITEARKIQLLMNGTIVTVLPKKQKMNILKKIRKLRYRS